MIILTQWVSNCNRLKKEKEPNCYKYGYITCNQG